MVIKDLHVALAFLTAAGFVLRGAWALTGSTMLQARWVRIAPHVIDTLLLALGVTMAIQYSLSLTTPWLLAKLVGLLVYIGFGVLTLRGVTTGQKLIGLVGALLAVGYIFLVAYSKQAWPF